MYRGLVCDAAERVFAQHGLAGSPIARIARESRVSIGSIYRIFPGSKAEIYRVIQERRSTAIKERSHAKAIEAWENSGDLLDAIFAGLAALVDFFGAHADYLRIVLREERTWSSAEAGR